LGGDGLELRGDNVDGLVCFALLFGVFVIVRIFDGKNTQGLVKTTHLERLSAAQNDAQATVKRSLGLAGDELEKNSCVKIVIFLFAETPQHNTHLVVLAQHSPPLTMPQHSPSDTAILELVDADLAGEGAIGPIEDVLRGDLEAGAQVLARQQQVQGGRGDDDLCNCVRACVCQ